MKGFTFIEVLTEIEGYIEDCNNREITIEKRIYTNGDDIISVDWAERIFISECNDIYLGDRNWALILDKQ